MYTCTCKGTVDKISYSIPNKYNVVDYWNIGSVFVSGF